MIAKDICQDLSTSSMRKNQTLGGRQLPKTNALGLSGGNVSAIAALSYLVNLLEIGEGNSCVVTMKLALIRAWDQHRPRLFC
jgi:hypothetical protein